MYRTSNLKESRLCTTGNRDPKLLLPSYTFKAGQTPLFLPELETHLDGWSSVLALTVLILYTISDLIGGQLKTPLTTIVSTFKASRSNGTKELNLS